MKVDPLTTTTSTSSYPHLTTRSLGTAISDTIDRTNNKNKFIYAEVWCFTTDRTKLFQPDGGRWIDPTTVNGIVTATTTDTALRQLMDKKHPHYLPPQPQSPGCGLPGILCTETGLRNVIWRYLPQLSIDPDQTPDERLQLFHNVNCFGDWVVGVPFRYGSSKGVVLFVTRETTGVRARHQSQTDDRELKQGVYYNIAPVVHAVQYPKEIVKEHRPTKNHHSSRCIIL